MPLQVDEGGGTLLREMIEELNVAVGPLLGVDTSTLIRTIDRFIMFYIRTANRLQRTASWLESLDGGLDYLRSVIVGDSLGIAAFPARRRGGQVEVEVTAG